MFRKHLMGSAARLFAPDGGAGDGGASGGEGAAAAGAAAAGAAAAGAGGATEAGGQDWTASLDPDSRTFVTTKGYKTPADLVKAYRSAESIIGMEKIPVPGKDAGEDVWNLVYDKLGRPKDGKYEFKKPEGAGEAFDAFTERLGKKMHGAGASQRQVDAMVDFMTEFAKENIGASSAAEKAAFEEADQKLKSEWGAKYEINREAANRGAAWLGQEFGQLMEKVGMANNPVFIKAMHKLGAASADDSLRGSGQNQSFTMTPGEAKAEIAKMEGDPKHPIWVKDHPEHKLAVERKTALYRMAYPDDENRAA